MVPYQYYLILIEYRARLNSKSLFDWFNAIEKREEETREDGVGESAGLVTDMYIADEPYHELEQ